MTQATTWISLLAICTALLGGGCEAIIDDFEAGGCPVDPPQTCADIGEEMAEVGCCSGDSSVVYFCSSGVLGSTSCAAQDLTCDFDPDQEIMTCVQ